MKGILFDLDETLFDRTTCMLSTARSIANSLKNECSSVNIEEFVDTFMKADEKKTKLLFAQNVLKRYPILNMSPKKFIQLRDDIAINNSSLFSGVIELLKELQTLKYKIGIVSNASRKDYQRIKVNRLGLDPFMDTVIISDDTLKKPDQQIFLKAANELNLMPEKVAFVGDNPSADIDGANRAGMTSVYVINRRFGKDCLEADFIIDSVVELTKLSFFCNNSISN